MIRAFERVSEKFALLSSLVRILAADDVGEVQVLRVDGLVGELRDGVQRFQEYGFSSNPPEGSTGVAIALGGNREDLVVVGTEHRSSRRRNLPVGAAAIYSNAPAQTECSVDSSGNASLVAALTAAVRGESGVLIQSTSGSVAITAGASSIVIGPSGITITGPTVTINGINFSTHVHGGVQAGAGTTGAPQ